MFSEATEKIVLHSKDDVIHLRPQEDGPIHLRPIRAGHPLDEGVCARQYWGNNIQPEEIPVRQIAKGPTFPDDIRAIEVEDGMFQDGDIFVSSTESEYQEGVRSIEGVEKRNPTVDGRIKITWPIFPPGIPKVEHATEIRIQKERC